MRPKNPSAAALSGRAALRAHGARQPEAFHEPEPSGPPVVASPVGMDHGTGVVGQRLRRLGEHPVGELRVGMEAGRVGDDLAVMAVDHRREVHLPVPGLDLADVRQPLLIGPFGGEVPVDEITGSGRGLPLVGAVTPPFGNMRREPALGHDPADHLLRDARPERGLDATVPVPALGVGERPRHAGAQPGVLVNADPGMVVVVAARRYAQQAGHRPQRIPRPQPVDRHRLLPVRQAPQVGAWAFSASLHHLPHQRVLQLQLLDPTAQRLHVIAAPGIRPAPRTDGRRFPALGGILVPGLQRGHAAPAVRPDPVVHRTNAHAKLFGGLLLLHAAQHQFDRLPSCLQRNYGFGHTASIPGILRQPAFQALSGRIAQALHHLRGGHRRCEV